MQKSSVIVFVGTNYNIVITIIIWYEQIKANNMRANGRTQVRMYAHMYKYTYISTDKMHAINV